jgi:hypothetical protein
LTHTHQYFRYRAIKRIIQIPSKSGSKATKILFGNLSNCWKMFSLLGRTAIEGISQAKCLSIFGIGSFYDTCSTLIETLYHLPSRLKA